MLGETSDGEFKLLRIRELDETMMWMASLTLQMKVSKRQHWPMNCGAV